MSALENSNAVAQAAFNGGIVSNDTEFMSSVVFNAITTFKGQAIFAGSSTFNGDVEFNGAAVFSQNSGGNITIPAGLLSGQVSFTRSLTPPPTVTATPQEFIEGSYRVTALNSGGFVVELSQTQPIPVKFNWTAIQTK
ncbi:MAG: Tail fiber protein [Patescibacteria group bacterium]|nr:Tail fiber protein [Patescibacteria group bacterium]